MPEKTTKVKSKAKQPAASHVDFCIVFLRQTKYIFKPISKDFIPHKNCLITTIEVYLFNLNVRWIKDHIDQKDNTNHEPKQGDTHSVKYWMACMPCKLGSRKGTNFPRIQFLTTKATEGSQNAE